QYLTDPLSVTLYMEPEMRSTIRTPGFGASSGEASSWDPVGPAVGADVPAPPSDDEQPTKRAPMVARAVSAADSRNCLFIIQSFGGVAMAKLRASSRRVARRAM